MHILRQTVKLCSCDILADGYFAAFRQYIRLQHGIGADYTIIYCFAPVTGKKFPIVIYRPAEDAFAAAGKGLLMQLSLSVCVMALLLPVIYIALPAAALLAFALTSVSTALVDSYSSALIASTSLGRVRFMFSLLYSRLLLRGSFIKTVVYYTIICAVSSIIFALPAIGAAALSLSGSSWAVAGWGAAALVQTMLAGISMCIYTGRMLQLEQKNAAALKQFTFVMGNGGSNGDAEN